MYNPCVHLCQVENKAAWQGIIIALELDGKNPIAQETKLVPTWKLHSCRLACMMIEGYTYETKEGEQ